MGTQRHTQRDDGVNTQGEDIGLYTRERGLRGTSPAHAWISDLQPPGLGERNLWFE